MNIREKLHKIDDLLAALLLTVPSLFLLVQPVTVHAAGQLTSRKLALSTSQGNASATWTFTFSVTEATALNGISFEVCTTATGSCSAPGSWTNSGSAFGSLTYNGSNQTGWALDNTSGFLRIKNNSSAASVTSPVVVTFNTVTNPNTTNATFFARILTYSGDDFTTQVDNGVVAASTAQQISVTAQVDESLTFCTGTSGITTTSCTGATGNAVSLLTAGGANVSPSNTAYGTSQIGVGTNGLTGYTLTVNGSTLTCSTCGGSPTITALGSLSPSTTGVEQFGMNLRDNATPNVGTDPQGSGTATPTANYNDVDDYIFNTGDTIASKGSSDQFRLYTVSYIANIDTATQSGAYTTTLTYIATATF